MAVEDVNLNKGPMRQTLQLNKGVLNRHKFTVCGCISVPNSLWDTLIVLGATVFAFSPLTVFGNRNLVILITPTP